MIIDYFNSALISDLHQSPKEKRSPMWRRLSLYANVTYIKHGHIFFSERVVSEFSSGGVIDIGARERVQNGVEQLCVLNVLAVRERQECLQPFLGAHRHGNNIMSFHLTQNELHCVVNSVQLTIVRLLQLFLHVLQQLNFAFLFYSFNNALVPIAIIFLIEITYRTSRCWDLDRATNG